MSQSYKQQACSKPGAWIALSVLLTAIVVGGGVYAWQQKALQQEQNVPSAGNEMSPIPFETKDENKDESTPTNEQENPMTYSTYTNSSLGYEIQYPTGYQLSDHTTYKENELEYHSMGFYNGKELVFSVWVDSNSTGNLYLDQPPTSTTTLGGQSANLYVSTTGYGDAGRLGVPYTAVQTYKNGKQYVVKFENVNEISETNKTILVSFKFL